MNKRGYVYFIEIIVSVVFVTFLFFSLKPSNIGYEIDDEYSNDLLFILHNQNLLENNLNESLNGNFEGYINDTILTLISETKDFEINYNSDDPIFSNLTGKTKNDLSYGNFHIKNLNNDWYTINLYTWSKL